MIKKIVFLGISLLFLTLSVSAQVTRDTLIAYQYYQKADSLLTDKKHEESIELFTKALPVYEKAKAWERVASCYNKISENHRYVQNLKESLKAANNALEICSKKTDKNTIEESKSYFNKACYFLKTRSINDAIVNFNKALDIQLSIIPKPNSLIKETYVFLARAYYILEKYSISLEHMQKAVMVTIDEFGIKHPEVARIYINMGAIYERKGEYISALEHYKKAESILIKSNKNISDINKNRISAIYHNTGVIHANMGHYNASLVSFKRALKLKKQLHGENHPSILNTYNSIGLIYNYIGQYHLALDYIKKSYLNSEKEEVLSTPLYHNNMSLVYQKMKNHRLALEHQNKALSIWGKSNYSNSSQLINLYVNIAISLKEIGEYNEAILFLEKAINIFETQKNQDKANILNAYLELGNIYVKKKEYATALINYHKAQRLYDEVHNSKHPGLAICYNRIGNLYVKVNNHKKALEYYQNAIVANDVCFDPASIYENPSSESSMNIQIQIISLFNKAKTLLHLNKSSNDLSFLRAALSTYSIIDDYINISGNIELDYEDRVKISESNHEIYSNAIVSELTMASKKDENEHLKNAFYYAERSKANTLKTFLAAEDAKKFMKLPFKLNEEEKKLRVNYSFYKSKITKELSLNNIDSIKIKKYESILFTISRKQDSLTEIIKKNYPKYYQLKYKNEVVSVSEIQERLDKKTTVLDFFVADSTTYAFTISKNDIRVKELGTPKLEEDIERLREAITSENATNYKKIGHTLYKELVAPIKNNIRGNNLIIIPDGVLWHLNFDLLLTKQEAEKNSRNLSYLLRDYAISYANSADLLFKSPKNISNSSEIRKECLAFSFSDSTNLNTNSTISLAALRDAGDDLPGTRQEIKAISEIIDGQYYYGAEAIERNFKKHANNYSILHLALHGDVDHKNPQNSKLYFTKSKDTLEDNLLYSHELFALDIPAELTVLSACNTGTGKIANGEGVLSLGTAFQYAGTKSLLLSNWEVSDKTTPQLMQYFYANLKDRMNKAEALQQAKLQFLTTTETFYTHPFYWGSFYVLGDINPIDIGNPYTIYYWIFGAFLITFISFLFYKKRKSLL